MKKYIIIIKVGNKTRIAIGDHHLKIFCGNISTKTVFYQIIAAFLPMHGITIMS